jgi:hypothetical protein
VSVQGEAAAAAAAAHLSRATELRAALQAIRRPSGVEAELGARRAADAVTASRRREARAAVEIATLQLEIGVAERYAGAAVHWGAMRVGELEAKIEYWVRREEYAGRLAQVARAEAERAREAAEAEVVGRAGAAEVSETACDCHVISMQQALCAETHRAAGLADEVRGLRRQLGAGGVAGGSTNGVGARGGGRRK